MKFATFVLIVSLCLAAVNAFDFIKFVKKSIPSKQTAKCAVDEAVKINKALMDMPNISACDDKRVKKLLEREDEIINICKDIYNGYKKQSKTIVFAKAVQLAFVGFKFINSVTDVDDASDLANCVKADLKPIKKLLKQSFKNVRACSKK